MFAGHAALALAAKTRAPTLSLGWLMAAAYGLDVVWPVLLLTGVERVSIVPGATAFNALVFEHYPWSHSLAMALLWSVAGFLLARWSGVPRRATLLVGVLVVSHWVLDFVVHQPDLEPWPGATSRFGLGLWDSVLGTLLIEGALYVGGIALYLRSTRPLDNVGNAVLWSLLAFLTLVWASSPWAPPPPDTTAIAVVGLTMPLLFLWAAWADRHRVPRPRSTKPPASE
jgi:hypothetical protein